jgi:mRNA interferase YafQ
MNIQQTSQFKKDVKRQKRRGKDLEKLKAVIALLVSGDPLPPHYNDHALYGDWKRHRDCHVEPDWLLIYRLEGKTLFLERTGTHSDLF